MKCLKCGHHVREAAKFCDECGAPLHVTQSAVDVHPEPTRTHLIPEPERKHVTALFSDLSGYTAMTEKLDPEQVKEITSRIFIGVKEVVAKYEGFIERVMGDGCVAFFGIPRGHEDDPIRAIHAALEIHDLVKALSPQYESRVGAPLTMHSGINTGLVLTADVDPEKGTHGVAGDAVNVTSRLSGMAGAGEILVGEETVRRAKGRFVFVDLGRRQAKGKAEPITVFKVISAKTPATGTGSDRQVSSEMVGRDRELDRLEFQVMKAINGEGSVVHVIGEAGIGKSRLIAELKKREVMKRVTLLEGRAISIGKNLSFHPIIDLLKQWARIADGDSEAAAFDKLEKAIRTVHPEEAHEILPFVATLMGMKLTGKHADRVKGIEGEALEKLIFKNIRELVIKGAELRPTVVVMDDLHWADTSSIELLEALCRLAEKHRIAFVNVFRPGYFESDDGKIASVGTRLPACYVEITIQALDRTNSETLIHNMLVIKGLPYAVKNQILERAGGNPFFIEEVVRSLIDVGAVIKRDGGFEVTEKIEKVVIPPTINDVLMARIDRLEERTRELVKVASVIGRSFFDRIIKDVADSIEDVDHRLEYLKDIQLIRDRTRMQELEHLFKHALAQEAAYESTLLQQRKALHLKVAQSIEKLFQDRLHEFYGMLAYHYSKGEDPEKAEEYMTRAGEEALRSSASSEALTYYQEALRLYQDKYGDTADPEKLAAFEKNIALAYDNKGQYANAVSYFDKVFARWGRRPPTNRVHMTAKLASDILLILLIFYLPWARGKRTPDQRVNEFFHLALKKDQGLTFTNPRRFFTEIIGELRESLEYDTAKLDSAAVLHLTTSFVFSGSGFFRMGELVWRRGKKLVDEKRIEDIACYQSVTTWNNYFSGNWAEIPAYDKSLFDAATKSGLLWYMSGYLGVQGLVKVNQGRFGEAKELLEIVTLLTENYQFGGAQPRLLSTGLLAASRRLRLAETAANNLISYSVERTLEGMELLGIGSKAVIQILMKNIAGANDSLGQSEQIKRKRPFWPPYYLSSSLLAQFVFDVRMLEDAIGGDSRSLVSQCARNALKSGKKAVKNSAKFAADRTWNYRLTGEYYWLVGKQHKALKWWDKSIKEGERLGARPDLSRTYFEVGKRLLEPQSKYKELNGIDAKGYLDKAEILFREMGLEHDLDQLDRLRADCGM